MAIYLKQFGMKLTAQAEKELIKIFKAASDPG